MAVYTVEEYSRRLQGLLREMEANRDQDAKLIATDALALVKRRVINQGINALGRPFSPYSPSYARYRAEIGRRIDIKNFSLTGQMWKDVQPVLVQDRGQIAAVSMTAITEESRRKLLSNSQREGIFIGQASEDELALVDQANLDRFLGLLRKWGLD